MEDQPELLARHCAAAGLGEKAVVYWTLAGEWAVKRDANAEATRHFRRALELLEKQPETPERSEAELKVLIEARPGASIDTRALAPPEVESERTYAPANFANNSGRPVELFQAALGAMGRIA